MGRCDVPEFSLRFAGLRPAAGALAGVLAGDPPSTKTGRCVGSSAAAGCSWAGIGGVGKSSATDAPSLAVAAGAADCWSAVTSASTFAAALQEYWRSMSRT